MAKKKASKKRAPGRPAAGGRGRAKPAQGKAARPKSAGKKVAKKTVATKKVAKKRVATKKVAKKKVARKVARKPVAKKRVATKKVAKKKVARKPVAKKRVATKKVAKKKVARKVAGKPVAKKRVATKKVAEKRIAKGVVRTVTKPARKAHPPSPRKTRPVKAMKKSETSKFRQLLLEKRESLLSDLESLESQAFKTSGQDASANHMADFGSDNYEQEFTFGLIENDEVVMRQITAAFKRIDAGHFGLCQGCGQRIPVPRLEVLPWAAYCVPCQEQNERL